MMPKMLTQNWGEGMDDIKNGNGKANNDGITRIDDGEKNH
jgi:hypothetical protein